MRNWYDVLGTTSKANDRQLKSAFRELAKSYHPDLHPDDKQAEERFKEVNQAYEVLRDPATRAFYDASLADKRIGARQRLRKTAATGSATFALSTALCLSLMIWLKREGFILAQHETESLSKNVTTAVPSGTGGAWGEEDGESRTSASQRETNESMEIRTGQALPLVAQPASNRNVQASWIWYHRHRGKVALSRISDAYDETEKSPSGKTPSQGESEQAVRLLDRGQRFATQGNLVIAREYFARAAALGLPIAALRLAETHDPQELKHFKIHGLKPDLSEAKKWYQRAIELGVLEAEAKLRRLSAP